eukprot:GHVU01020954.1.p3 GENE.GHVU01020954.1~~GHVU01020954.1.p3  ORF type:complete len:172 (+),score=29.14 GHVU01020954.1:1153-1668(+)
MCGWVQCLPNRPLVEITTQSLRPLTPPSLAPSISISSSSSSSYRLPLSTHDAAVSSALCRCCCCCCCSCSCSCCCCCCCSCCNRNSMKDIIRRGKPTINELERRYIVAFPHVMFSTACTSLLLAKKRLIREQAERGLLLEEDEALLNSLVDEQRYRISTYNAFELVWTWLR